MPSHADTLQNITHKRSHQIPKGSHIRECHGLASHNRGRKYTFFLSVLPESLLLVSLSGSVLPFEGYLDKGSTPGCSDEMLLWSWFKLLFAAVAGKEKSQG